MTTPCPFVVGGILIGSRLRVRVLCLVGLAVLAIGCVGPDVSHYAAALDGLTVPSSWQLVHSTIRKPGGADHDVQSSRATDEIDCATITSGCPSVTRYYLVDGRPVDIYPIAKSLLVAAGLSIDQEIAPHCDQPPSGPACVVSAIRGSDVVRVTLYNPGEDVSALAIAQVGHSIVLVSAEGKK